MAEWGKALCLGLYAVIVLCQWGQGQRLLPGQLLSVPIVGGRWRSPRRFRARWTLTRNSIQG